LKGVVKSARANQRNGYTSAKGTKRITKAQNKKPFVVRFVLFAAQIT